MIKRHLRQVTIIIVVIVVVGSHTSADVRTGVPLLRFSTWFVRIVSSLTALWPSKFNRAVQRRVEQPAH